MKNLTSKIVTVVSALTIASSAMAYNDVNNIAWTGNSGTVSAEGCQFRFQANSTMNLGTGEEAHVWSAATKGTIQVRSRNISSLEMTSDNVLRDANGAATDVVATVDYTAGVNSLIQTNTGGTISKTATSLGVTGITSTEATTTNFHPGGTATMGVAGLTGTASNQAALNALTNGTVYTVNHTVTCTQ